MQFYPSVSPLFIGIVYVVNFMEPVAKSALVIKSSFNSSLGQTFSVARRLKWLWVRYVVMADGWAGLEILLDVERGIASHKIGIQTFPRKFWMKVQIKGFREKSFVTSSKLIQVVMI